MELLLELAHAPPTKERTRLGGSDRLLYEPRSPSKSPERGGGMEDQEMSSTMPLSPLSPVSRLQDSHVYGHTMPEVNLSRLTDGDRNLPQCGYAETARSLNHNALTLTTTIL